MLKVRREQARMPARLVHRFASTLNDSDHPYLNGAWTPMTEEWDADDCAVVAGAIPRDLSGVYLRNSENPLHEPLGRYHPFDGDGLLHALHFRDGRASYRNRFVRTEGFLAEQQAGRSLWSGLAEAPARSERPGWGAHGALKDASSTDVVVHRGLALSSFYQCGALYQLDPVTLEQFGPATWDGRFPQPEGVSAHSKFDPATGELLFFNYGKQAPYLHCGTLAADGTLKDYRAVPLPGPRLPHDMAFTPRFMILNDLPLFWDADLLAKNLHAARLHAGLPSRFALVPRNGHGAARWFEASPTYVLHWVNAWDDGDEVVLDGYRQREPMPPPLAGAPRRHAQMMAYLDLHSMRPQLWRWRFNLVTGTTREAALDDRVWEFGSFDRRCAGRAHRHVYNMLGEPGWFLFKGIEKFDTHSGAAESLEFGAGIFGSETPFAPRDGGTAEDDGYLLSYVTDLNRNGSECWIIAAQDLGAGPIAKVRLPARIPSGTHACWASAEQLVKPGASRAT
ncbi:MAG: carotenoid oxygenase family protein [Nevskia sp.]